MDAPLIKKPFTGLPEELPMSTAHINNDRQGGVEASMQTYP